MKAFHDAETIMNHSIHHVNPVVYSAVIITHQFNRLLVARMRHKNTEAAHICTLIFSRLIRFHFHTLDIYLIKAKILNKS